MRPAENIEKLIRDVPVNTSSKTDKAVLGDTLKAFENSRRTKSAKPEANISRIIMKKPIAKLVSAAAVILIAVLGISLLQNSATTAYAIEQTIEAGQDMRYLHFYHYASLDSNAPDKEAWLEYDDSGQIKNIRVNWYNYYRSGDMVAVWKEGRTQYWTKKEKTLLFFEDEIYTKKMVGFAKRYDPTRAVENMYDLERKGDVKIEIDEPADKTKPIILTGTYLPNTFITEGTSPQVCAIVFIDPSTKLVTSIEEYELRGDKYVSVGFWEYPDYDTLFEPGIFDLEEEAPVDVKRLDQMTLDIGLEQTDLTEKEIAVKVVRSFLQALIAKDYDRAIEIYGYEDPDEKEGLLKSFEKLSIVRIISIDDPIFPRFGSGRLEVPCKVELEEDGQIIEWQMEDVFAQRVTGHPNRWRVEAKFEE